MRSKAIAAGVAVLVALGAAGAARADSGHGGQGHVQFSAGMPGDPKKPARLVEVTMREGDGTMEYVPNRIEVKRNEQIRFVLKNAGELAHEFVLASAADNAKHAALMQKFPDMEHDDPNSKTLPSKAGGEIVWRFTKTGEFEFACLIPGHREAGMIGKIIVK
ncbi:cupredoxin family protein [Xanthobacteraceae bacterium Astr-EGSB]|uniref:cupredoxin domain-containing protein n=1 Tax=Astrobacterium formosum TaxID=3069710 RepID=UPI0027B6B888|nr:cupredoxin family protein [Xanthobacteraceae bacterium Astr-EGSB]